MLAKALNVLKVEELRKKIVVTLALLFVYRVGFQVPIPGISLSRLEGVFEAIKQQQAGPEGAVAGFVSIISVLSAGGILSFGIFSMGIMPYISSSIIFSILGKVVPSIERMVKEGSQGQKRLNQWMRWGTVPICVVQAVFLLEGVILNPGQMSIPYDLVVRADYEGVFPGFALGFYLPALLALTAGTIFLMWVGEQITEYGVGNGISLLIMAGILSSAVDVVQGLFVATGSGAEEAAMAAGAGKAALLLVIYLAVSLSVVYVTKGSRRIPIQYARMVRGRGVYGGQKHYMPLKVNQANVMPVIFASSLMAFPGVLFAAVDWQFGKDLFQDHRSWVFTVCYVALIFFFSFFWVQLMFQPKEMAKNMKEYGAFVPGIRPGNATADFLDRIMVRLTLAGAIFLATISLLPNLVSATLDISPMAASFLGGTSILIVVAVALDLVDRMNAQLLMRNYEGFMKGGGGPGR
jgi:preprotein translocase subunit SecY